MIPTGPAPVRSLPVRKGPRGVRQVEVSPGRWMDEAVAIAKGIPLTYPLPTNGAGPVVRRHEAPEVPSMPAAGPAKPVQTTSRTQDEAWRLCHDEGMYWTDAAKVIGTTPWTVQVAVKRYMEIRGIKGDPPGKMPRAEASRRALAAKGITPKGAPAPIADRVVLAPEGHPWATDPEPIELGESGADHAETIPAAIPDADPGHEMTAPTGGEPEPVASPAKGTPAPHHPDPLHEDLSSSDQAPHTGGGGRDVAGDDFLSRVERELDRLARTDAKLVEEERSVARQRAELAARIERLRTAGEVYRAVMAGRAA